MAVNLNDLVERVQDYKREYYVESEPWQDQDQVLVHYTNLGAVWNMVSSENGGIRAFGTKDLDDPTEGRVTHRDAGIETALERSNPQGWCNRRYREAAVCCFVAGDLHKQIADEVLLWKLYGWDGAGVSIAIEAGTGAKWLSEGKVEKVQYTARMGDGFSNVTVLEEMIADINEAAANQTEETGWGTLRKACDDLFKQRFLTKADAYSHEREVRSVRWKEKNGHGRGERVFQADGARIREAWQYPEFQASEWLRSGTRITFGAKVQEWERASEWMKNMIAKHHSNTVADGIDLRRSGQAMR